MRCLLVAFSLILLTAMSAAAAPGVVVSPDPMAPGATYTLAGCGYGWSNGVIGVVTLYAPGSPDPWYTFWVDVGKDGCLVPSALGYSLPSGPAGVWRLSICTRNRWFQDTCRDVADTRFTVQ
jgi:hypothetical protein